MPADAPLQVAVSANQPMDCEGCEKASVGNPPQSFVLQVISFDSPSVTYSKNAVLSCDRGPQAVSAAPTKDNNAPGGTSQQDPTDPCGAAAVSVTSVSYGVFKMPHSSTNGLMASTKP
uniref:Uncharacterized protein n=1 Tax=Sphaerodactylus townsendi TaxID=933632 RepID=A0ACB8GFY1_9SAUR